MKQTKEDLEKEYRKFQNDRFLQNLNKLLGEVYATACPVGLLIKDDGTPEIQYDNKTLSLISKIENQREEYIKYQYPNLINDD